MTELCLVAKTFGIRPSSLISGLDGYTAYSFDVAAAIYVMHLKKGDKPMEDVDAMSFL